MNNPVICPISFVVHFDSIPGRVAILCMTLLTLLNASTSAREVRYNCPCSEKIIPSCLLNCPTVFAKCEGSDSAGPLAEHVPPVQLGGCL